MSKNTCKTCCWWITNISFDTDGECHGAPPTARISTSHWKSSGIACWPQTSGIDFCGAWKAQDE